MLEQKTKDDGKMMRITITIQPELYEGVMELISDVQKERHERFSVSQFVRELIKERIEQIEVKPTPKKRRA